MTRAAKGKTTQQPTRRGPVINAALLCTQLLVEPDSVVSAIRIVDRFAVGGPVEILSTDEAFDVQVVPIPHRIEFELLLMFKEFHNEGSDFVTVEPFGPDGESIGDQVPVEVLVTPPLMGGNAHVKSGLILMQAGVHWLSVRYGGREITRITFVFEDHRTRRRIATLNDATPGVMVVTSGDPPK